MPKLEILQVIYRCSSTELEKAPEPDVLWPQGVFKVILQHKGSWIFSQVSTSDPRTLFSPMDELIPCLVVLNQVFELIQTSFHILELPAARRTKSITLCEYGGRLRTSRAHFSLSRASRTASISWASAAVLSAAAAAIAPSVIWPMEEVWLAFSSSEIEALTHNKGKAHSMSHMRWTCNNLSLDRTSESHKKHE